jgi:hybrid cluster-associated redox disulfide protein
LSPRKDSWRKSVQFADNETGACNLLVDDVMRRWPATIRVFMEQGMYCVGCPIAPFHTVEEACHAHGIEQGLVVASLQAIAEVEESLMVGQLNR